MCPACGATNQDGAGRCAVCSALLAEATQPEAEERKLVSVLFADVGRSLAMIRGRDPEAARDLLAPAVARMVRAVRRHGGTVAQQLGDGIMAVFGAPEAREDHAAAACLAAIAIRDDIAAAHGEDAPHVVVRVGVHSGEVLIRTPAAGSGVVLQPIGEAVHIASRLERAAPPGTVLASAETARLAGAWVESSALPAARLKGLSRPLPVVRLLAAGQPSAEASAAPLIGRGREMAALAGALAAAPGQAQLILLTGEPGCGKSRLAAELVRNARGGGAATVTLACQPFAEAPLVPLRRLLAALPPAGRAVPDVPALQALMHPAAPADDAWMREDPALRRRRMHAAGADRIAAAAHGRTLLLLLEDVHWLEPESLAVLQHLATLPAPGLIVLAGARPNGVPPALAAAPWEAIAVGPLGAEDCRTLARRLLEPMTEGIEPRLAERMVSQLVARSAGNPFFAEQIAAVWREAGPGEGSAALPGRLRVVLASRIDRLPAVDKALLEVAAVIGNDFTAGLLTEAAGLAGEAGRLSLARLGEAGMLRRAAERQLGFSHALIREALEAGLTRSRRSALHRAAFLAITRLHADDLDGHAEALVRHADGAGLGPEVVLHSRAAARVAMATPAPEAALGHLERALAALSALPETEPNRRTRLAVLLALRDPLFRLGAIARIRAVLQEAAMLTAALAERQAVAQVAIFSSHAHWLAGDPVAAATDATRAADLAAAAKDPALALRARFQLGLTRLAAGRLIEAASDMQAVAAALSDGSVPHGAFGLDHSLAATAFGYRARALVECGRCDDALAAVDAAAAAAERDGRPFARIFASLAASTVAMGKGQWTQAVAGCTGAVDWCRVADARLMRPVALGLLGQALLGAGQAAAAADALQEAVREADAMGFAVHQAQRLALLAEAELTLVRAESAARHARRAKALARRHGEAVSAAMVQRVEGLVAAARDDDRAARRLLMAAGRAADQMGLAPLAARAAGEAAALRLRMPMTSAAVRNTG